MIEKQCSSCLAPKSLDQFYKLKHCLYGVSNLCKKCSLEKNKLHYQNNKDKYKNRASTWAKNNPERRKQIVNKYDEINIVAKRKRGVENNKQRRINDIEKCRLYDRQAAQIRRARMNNVKSTATDKQIKIVLSYTKGKCIYCDQEAKLTIDHFIPISKGGNHEVKNLLPCCKFCNSSKKNRNGYDWLIKNNNLSALKRIEKLMKKIHGIEIKEV